MQLTVRSLIGFCVRSGCKGQFYFLSILECQGFLLRVLAAAVHLPIIDFRIRASRLDQLLNKICLIWKRESEWCIKNKS